MPEVVESLVTEIGADVSGLDRAATDVVGTLQRIGRVISTGVPPLTINTTGVETGVTRSLGLIERFATTLAGVTTTIPPLQLDTSPAGRGLADVQARLQSFVREAQDLARFPTFSTAQAQTEVRELLAQFTGLDAALKQIDPSGFLRGFAEQARTAAGELDALLAKSQQLTAPAPETTGTSSPQAQRLADALDAESAASARATASIDNLSAAEAQQAIAAIKAGAASAEAARQVEAQAQSAEIAAQRILQAQRLTAAIPPPPPPPATPTLLASQDDVRLAQNAEANAAATEHMGRAAGDAAAQTAILSRAIRETITFSERQAAAAQQAATGLTLQARAEAAATEASARASRAGAGPTASGALGAAAAANVLTTAQERAATGSEIFTARLRVQEQQITDLAAAERALATASRTTVGFAGATQQRAELDALTTSVNKQSAAMEGHSRNTGRAVNALTALTAGSVGAQSSVARLAETALLFSGGELAVVAVAAGVLALATAYSFLTAAERAHREEQDRLVKGLIDEANSAVPAAIQASNALAAALDHQREAREGLTASQVLKTEGRVLGAIAQPTEAFASEFIRRGLEAQEQATVAVEQAQRRLNNVLQDNQSTTVSTLSESIRLHTADAAEIERAQRLVTALTEIEKQGNLTAAERNKIIQERRTLLEALADTALREANRSAQAQATQDDLALQQQGFQAQQQALQAAHAQNLVSDQAFFAQRRQLLIAAAKADESSLQQQAQAAVAEPSADPAAFRAQQATEAHLQRQVTLRESLLQLQLAGNAADQAQAAIQEKLEFVRTAFTPATVPIVADITPRHLETELLTREEILGVLERTVAATKAGAEDDVIEKIRREAEILDPLLRDIGLKLKDIGNANIGAFQNLDAGIQGLESIVGALQDIGVASQETARDLNNIFDLTKAIASGDVLGAITSGISFIGGLFSESPESRERDRIIAENTAAINHLSTVADRAGAAITANQAAAGIAAAAAVPTDTTIGPKGTRFFNPEDFDTAVQSVLAQSGLDIQDLEQIAERHGIHLLDQQGHLIPQAIDDFNEAVKSGVIPMSELVDATNQAVSAMLGVPDVFKVDTARAIVQQAEPNPLTTTGPVTTGPGGSESSVRVSGQPSGPVTTVNNNAPTTITINLNAGNRNAAQLVDEMNQEIERRRMRTHGDVDATGPGFGWSQ